MDEADRDRYIEASEAWHDAEDAYREQAGKHIVMWWEGGGEVPPVPETLTKDALAKLSSLRQEADDKQKAFEAVATSLGLL